MAPTIPYYVYELQLLARIDEPRFNDWQSFLALPGGKIGVLVELRGAGAGLVSPVIFSDQVAAPTPPKRRSRALKSAIAAAKCAASKSGHRTSRKTHSA